MCIHEPPKHNVGEEEAAKKVKFIEVEKLGATPKQNPGPPPAQSGLTTCLHPEDLTFSAHAIHTSTRGVPADIGGDGEATAGHFVMYFVI